MEEDETGHLPTAVTPKRDVIRVACGSAVCVVQPRPGKTGLKIEMRRFDVEREEFVVSSSLVIKGKKGSSGTEAVAAAYVENQNVYMPYVYLLVRHCYSDKEPLFAFGFIHTDTSSESITFICLREFRDGLLCASVRVWIMHGPVVVADGKPDYNSLFVGQIIYTSDEGLPKFITSHLPYPPDSTLITCQCTDPMLSFPCEQYAIFVKPHGESNMTSKHDLKGYLNTGTLDGLPLEYFLNGGQRLMERFRPKKAEGGWIIVPLKRDVRDHGSPSVSPISDDLPSRDEMETEETLSSDAVLSGHRKKVNYSPGWIPEGLAQLHNITMLAFSQEDDENSGDDDVAMPLVYIGTKAHELLIIKQGELASCITLSQVARSISKARVSTDPSILVVHCDDRTVHLLKSDGTHLQEIKDVVDVVVGDFLEVGRDQILLFHPAKMQKSGKPSKKDNFTLTDLRRTFSYPMAKERGQEAPPYSQSLQWVAYSLHCRLREGQTVLSLTKERCEAKKRLFNHAMQVLLALSEHEGDKVVVHSKYLPKLDDSKHFADGLVPLFDDMGEVDNPFQRLHNGLRLQVEDIQYTYTSGEWFLTVTLKNTDESKSVRCKNLFVSGLIPLSSTTSGGFSDTVEVTPASEVKLSTRVNARIDVDTLICVWLQVAQGSTFHCLCLGSIVLRARDQLGFIPDTNPFSFGGGSQLSVLLTSTGPCHSIQRAIEGALPVEVSSFSSDGHVNLLARRGHPPFRITLNQPPGATWMNIDVASPSHSIVSIVLPLLLSAMPQGLTPQPNALAGLELLSQVVHSLDDEVKSLSDLIEDILERNRSRKKMLKIMKITREEIDAQDELKRRYIRQQIRTDELFSYFLRSIYFLEKNPWTDSPHPSRQK